mgnify:CR=1 FL=1
MQRRRHRNKAADGYCNLILDLDVPVVEWISSEMLQNITMVIISSDGASRRNPGRASCAAVVHVVVNETLILVAYRGIRLGVCSNNISEFEGACLAHELLVQWAVTCKLCV